MKLVNQLLCGVHIAVAAEASGSLKLSGSMPGAAFDVVRHGAAASFMLEDRGARMVSRAFEDVHSALDIFVKDMGLVASAAQAARYSAPIATAAESGTWQRNDPGWVASTTHPHRACPRAPSAPAEPSHDGRWRCRTRSFPDNVGLMDTGVAFFATHDSIDPSAFARLVEAARPRVAVLRRSTRTSPRAGPPPTREVASCRASTLTPTTCSSL